MTYSKDAREKRENAILVAELSGVADLGRPSEAEADIVTVRKSIGADAKGRTVVLVIRTWECVKNWPNPETLYCAQISRERDGREYQAGPIQAFQQHYSRQFRIEHQVYELSRAASKRRMRST